MKIKQVYFKSYGPYKDWTFKPEEGGLHVIYGPNESGKTTFLEGFRSLLFGFKTKERKDSAGSLQFCHKDRDYFLGRDGKNLNFYRLGEESMNKEPSELWWHGLDRRTYERIFALHLDDLQGLDILNEVDVRTRFFGAEGGERLSEAVKDIERATADLLVSSANGKRKINLLIERLKQQEQMIQRLGQHEEEYIKLRQKLESTNKTEEELLESLRNWKDYNGSIDLVLRTWDTYKRAEEAKQKMDNLMQGSLPDQEAFLALDSEISHCRENMRIWRGKEEALIPDNFVPNAAVGTYSHEIDRLNEELARWEQLRKECEQGESYIKVVAEQLQMSRKMQTTWRESEEMPRNVDWFEGERLARSLRSAQDALRQWQLREPSSPEGDSSSEDGRLLGDIMSMKEEDLTQLAKDVDQMYHLYNEKEHIDTILATTKNGSRSTVLLNGIGVACLAVALSMYSLGEAYHTGAWLIVLVLCVLFGLGAFVLAQFQKKQDHRDSGTRREELSAIEAELKILAEKHGFAVPENALHMARIRESVEAQKKAFYGKDVAMAQRYAMNKQHESWQEEGRRLQETVNEEQVKWEQWRPKGANAVCGPEHFFAMKQEYDSYMEQYHRYEGYLKTLQARKDELAHIEDRAKALWEKIGRQDEPNPLNLRLLYKHLQGYRQNQIRYEQKESQRRTYREEYDKWHCKEKELLLQQDEILQKGGFSSAAEFRQKLLTIEQYRQWETIYKQSKVQLDLLAPNKDTYDLLLRRLREGNLQKWQDESARAQEQMASIENKLANLYEQRGELSETMRRLGSDQEMAKALQSKSQCETELRQALEDWAVQVYVAHFIEEAQQRYESEKQPQVLQVASSYVYRLTGGKYKLSHSGEDGAIVAIDEKGQPVLLAHWSSGLADQVYLALRLSLAKRFGEQVEPLPIVLDDILLRFDESRQKEALRLLAEMSVDEQIFLFTCQEQTMRLARALNDERIHCYEFNPTGLTLQ